jgi:predicted nucleic acid-binding protein
MAKEFYNAIWKAAYLFKTLDYSSARRILELFNMYLEKNILIQPEGKYIDTAFNNISINKSILNYDALYIPLAVNKGMLLLRLDKRRKNIALELGVNVLS